MATNSKQVMCVGPSCMYGMHKTQIMLLEHDPGLCNAQQSLQGECCCSECFAFAHMATLAQDIGCYSADNRPNRIAACAANHGRGGVD